MELLVWIGAAITVLGLLGLVYCIVVIAKARKSAAGDDDALRTKVAAMVPINLGAFLLSALGLMLVVTGVILS